MTRYYSYCMWEILAFKGYLIILLNVQTTTSSSIININRAVLVTNCWLERMWIEYWAKINIISTYSPHIINILSISTFHQQEIPQLIFKLPITQQVNGKEPTTNSTFIELTHSLPCTYHLIPILEWIICWYNVEMGWLLEYSCGQVVTKAILSSSREWGRCWEIVDIPYLLKTCHLLKVTPGRLYRNFHAV